MHDLIYPLAIGCPFSIDFPAPPHTPSSSPIVNWDFENCDERINDAARRGAYRIDKDHTELKHWKVTVGSVELIGRGYFTPQHGDFCVDLNGWGTGAIEQASFRISGADVCISFVTVFIRNGAHDVALSDPVSSANSSSLSYLILSKRW